MRVSTMIRINAAMAADGGLMDRMTNFGRQVEARGFPGIWITMLSTERRKPRLCGLKWGNGSLRRRMYSSSSPT